MQHAGSLDGGYNRGLLRSGVQLRAGLPEVEVVDESRHDDRTGVIGVASGLSDCDAVVSGEVLT